MTPLTRQERDYVDILRRRAAHLASRVEDAKQRNRNLSYDECERAALLWALHQISKTRAMVA